MFQIEYFNANTFENKKLELGLHSPAQFTKKHFKKKIVPQFNFQRIFMYFFQDGPKGS